MDSQLGGFFVLGKKIKEVSDKWKGFRGECLRKDRKCGVDKSENVKNEEVVTSGHLSSLGHGQLGSIFL